MPKRNRNRTNVDAANRRKCAIFQDLAEMWGSDFLFYTNDYTHVASVPAWRFFFKLLDEMEIIGWDGNLHPARILVFQELPSAISDRRVEHGRVEVEYPDSNEPIPARIVRPSEDTESTETDEAQDAYDQLTLDDYIRLHASEIESVEVTGVVPQADPRQISFTCVITVDITLDS